MPDDNIEILRRGIDAFNARDIEGMLEIFEPEVELRSAFAQAMAGTAVYTGHEGMREWHRDLEETWSDIHLTLKDFVEREDYLLALYEMRGRGRQSKAEVTMPVAHFMRIRDGRIVWLKTYNEPDDARRDFAAATGALESVDP